jgi:hypothetical protein
MYPRNILPRFNPKLSNILLVVAFKSQDRAKYGFRAIHKSVMKDLKWSILITALANWLHRPLIIRV